MTSTGRNISHWPPNGRASLEAVCVFTRLPDDWIPMRLRIIHTSLMLEKTLNVAKFGTKISKAGRFGNDFDVRKILKKHSTFSRSHAEVSWATGKRTEVGQHHLSNHLGRCISDHSRVLETTANNLPNYNLTKAFNCGRNRRVTANKETLKCEAGLST